MASLFGKYWLLYLASVVVILVSVISAIVVQLQLFKETNWLAIWLFKFVDDWAAPLSASAAILLIIAVFMTIRETRRRRVLNRIRTWASNAITLLKAPSTKESPALKVAELNEKFQAIKVGSTQVLADSKQIGLPRPASGGYSNTFFEIQGQGHQKCNKVLLISNPFLTSLLHCSN